MENAAKIENRKNSNLFINTISIVIPLVVAVLLGLPNKLELGSWTKTLPHLIGLINSLTTLSLIAGLIFIKLKKVRLHQAMMTTSFALGGLFLICYVLYHLTNPANKFNGEGAILYIYRLILITHIGLSLVVLPLVLRAMYYAAAKKFAAHKKIVRFAYPIWLYVSVTGVLVYLFVYQFFPAK
jgi:putative membrane protein